MAIPTPDRTIDRPSPEALLAAANRELRGKLKIFLGAAPGVGKTYEMLSAARQRRAEGVDVVVGVVETHGRAETAALLEGLETVPRRHIDYKGRSLEEMDIDAVLARRPALVLVDELAHTNAPGSRHPKRYLDVLELLAAGIDVYTTLNVQHVESLNDIVARITRIRVRETVPDSIVDGADSVEVIDLTPEDLIKRLGEGKVYVREAAERALKHYFSPGNLTALRELALRRTAERVDEQMRSYMREHAIAGPWAAGQRVLVCIDPSPDAENVVRAAKRTADSLRAPMLALYVETDRHATLSEAERGRLAETIRLAERLGAEAATIPGRRIAEDVLAFARERNVTRIVVGKSNRSAWFELLHGSVVDDLVRTSGGIAIEVVAATHATADSAWAGWRPERAPTWAYAEAALSVVVAGVIGVGIDRLVNLSNISLVFVVPVLLSAARHGIWPSVWAAALGAVAYNFFFLPPLYEFTITDPANVVALFFFLLVAVSTSALATRSRSRSLAARREAQVTAELYSFSRKIVGLADLDDLLWTIVAQIARMVRVEVVVLMPEHDRPGRTALDIKAAFPPEDMLEDADLAAALWCWDHDQPTGRGSDSLPGARRLFVPLRTARGKVAVLGVINRDNDAPLTPEQRRLLDALGDQAAVAIERVLLARDIDAARLGAERERLRSAMLTSVSHDLRTPLASILGAVSSLRSYGERYDPATRDELLATAQDEAERLNRFVGNLLDMTRLDAGAVSVKREPVDVADLIATALRRAEPLLRAHRVVATVAPDLAPVELDFVLGEQVLFNLLDNAAKYTPEGTTIAIEARAENGHVLLSVRDEGPGLAAADLPHVFEKFYRAREGDRRRAGTGLGLAIAKGFVEAQGGRIVARNRPGRSGAEFVISFPAMTRAAPTP
ncbi:sensor histidine kinase KdpD [Vineibacter terrae]|uniref:sensor histidine kinase KdpD n=1 Tax=Vineibacter terrae TaxID=2586908 RepID=UPI002E3119EE|nr:sensor histidine kinase KdpD [Vineibacter terrae]HEX2891693.1 sensor histidine kinase KdpD [Vineibacter terrae]